VGEVAAEVAGKAGKVAAQVADHAPPLVKVAKKPKRKGSPGASPAQAVSGPYDHLKEPRKVAEGKPPTAAQKRRIIAENKRQHDGQLTDDYTGEPLVPAQQSQRGMKPPPNEAQIDHLNPCKPSAPGAAPGTNSNCNLRVTSRAYNRQKSNRPPKPEEK
jgi:filamentous hemagglutinin